MGDEFIILKPFWNLLQESQNFTIELRDRFQRPPYLNDLGIERNWQELFTLLDQGVFAIERRCDLLGIRSEFDFGLLAVRKARTLYMTLLTFHSHLRKLLVNIEVAVHTQAADNYFRHYPNL